jgi:hypothetical protein
MMHYFPPANNTEALFLEAPFCSLIKRGKGMLFLWFPEEKHNFSPLSNSKPSQGRFITVLNLVYLARSAQNSQF